VQFLDVVRVDSDNGCETQQYTDDEGEVWEALHAEAEAVDFSEDETLGCEEEVE
jgi:hypothetical protein